MSRYKVNPVQFDRSKSYGENLAAHINKFWGAEVAVADGLFNVRIPRQIAGVPVQIAYHPHKHHPAVAYAIRGGSGRKTWFIRK